MATDFTQESVLRFIINNGGKVRNTDLLAHFRRFLREDEEREQNRELFKRFVNSVATVRQEEGVSHIVLRKKYSVHLGDIAKSPEPQRPSERDCKLANTQAALTVPARVEILPAAGIVNNNNNNIHAGYEQAAQTTVRALPVDSTSCAKQVNNTCTLKPTPSDSRSVGSGQSYEQPWDSKATWELEHSSVYPAKQRQLREADGCEQSFVTPTHCAYYEVKPSPLIEKSINTNSHTTAWPLHSTIGQSLVFKSSPCLADRPVSQHINPTLSRSNDSLLRPNVGFPIEEQDEFDPGVSVDDPPGYLQLNRPSSLSSSRDSVSNPSPSADSAWTQGFGCEKWSGDKGVGDENDVRSFLRRNQEARLLLQLHQPNYNIPSMHRSTGYLDDECSRTSTRSSSPETHRGPIVRRMTSRLRSRMCRSLGEDLDQPFPEDNLSTRHNRLQLLSSTLSMGNLVSSSSSRGYSPRALSSPAGSTHSLRNSIHDASFNNKLSSIPLDSREHAWFVKAASGSWTDIYSLFRDDPSLLGKRDFISGFTVLHWIAKHGDHRVLNTLSYGVEKSGMTLDVNAKTLCGYTPLHLAAIHGHKKLIRLLVQKYRADVRIRDSSGKRPWQYLGKDENRDILELLGAPQKRISGSPALSGLQSARPATTKVNVKRHTSIAALFKHKSHLRVSSTPEAF